MTAQRPDMLSMGNECFRVLNFVPLPDEVQPPKNQLEVWSAT